MNHLPFCTFLNEMVVIRCEVAQKGGSRSMSCASTWHLFFFFSNGSISEKWLPTALQNGFLYSQDSEKRLPTALRNGLLYSQIRGFQLPLEMGFLYSQDPYFMEWSLLLCLKLWRNHKLQHPEINFSLVYTY